MLPKANTIRRIVGAVAAHHGDIPGGYIGTFDEPDIPVAAQHVVTAVGGRGPGALHSLIGQERRHFRRRRRDEVMRGGDAVGAHLGESSWRLSPSDRAKAVGRVLGGLRRSPVARLRRDAWRCQIWQAYGGLRRYVAALMRPAPFGSDPPTAKSPMSSRRIRMRDAYLSRYRKRVPSS
jgi:hypothetical protein